MFKYTGVIVDGKFCGKSQESLIQQEYNIPKVSFNLVGNWFQLWKLLGKSWNTLSTFARDPFLPSFLI